MYNLYIFVSSSTVRNSVSFNSTVRNSVSSSSTLRNSWSCDCKLYACMPGLLTLVFLSCSHHTQCDQRGAKKYLLLQSKAMQIGSGVCVGRSSRSRHNCKV